MTRLEKIEISLFEDPSVEVAGQNMFAGCTCELSQRVTNGTHVDTRIDPPPI